MKKPINRSFVLASLAAAIAAVVAGAPRAFAAKAKDSTAAETKELEKEFEELGYHDHEVNLIGAENLNAEMKKQLAQQMLSEAKEQADRYTQFAAKSPTAADIARMKTLYNTAQLAYWGDVDSIAAIDEMTKSGLPVDAARGQIAKVFLAWRTADGNETEQTSAVSELAKLAKSNSSNNDISRAGIFLMDQHPASVKIAHQINLIVAGMKSPTAMAYSKLPNRIGEPLVISGNTVKGASFTTSKWKGEVVVVDFWATWCPPCREALPGLIEEYKKYHDQGFEIVGVSSDSTKTDLTKFLTDNPDMVWPELFTANTTGAWHPLTKKFYIHAIPTTLLIDRNGVLREEEMGRPLTKGMVEKVLAETADAPIKKPSVAAN